MVERKDGYPVETSHLALESRFETARGFTTLVELREAFCAETCRKFMVVVEGIDHSLVGNLSRSLALVPIRRYCGTNMPSMVHVCGYHYSVEVDLDEFHKVNLPDGQ
jgi:hypothetical protein